MNKKLQIMSLILVGILALVGFSGCGDAGGEAKTAAPVMLMVTNMAGEDGQMYQCDVLEGGSFMEDEVQLSVRVVPLSPDEDLPTSFYMDVIVKGYQVEYTRVDTGTEVPKAFHGSFNYYCPLNVDTMCDVIICKADMKMMPPLSYLWQFGYEPDTGLSIIHTTCSITIWGETVAGREVVADPFNFTMNFADWADD